jgi:hypothetical protein
MAKSIGFALAAAVVVVVTLGQQLSAAQEPAPEIDAATGSAAVALVTGAIFVIRSRRSK